MNSTLVDEDDDDKVPGKYIFVGAVLAISGNLLISISMNLQKYSHNQIATTDDSDGKAYLRSKVWWFGIVLMVFGEIGNFSAYGFAPASLVAPLGTTTVIANAIIAVVFLGENFRLQDLFGISMAVVGAFLLVTFSTKETSEPTAKQLMSYVRQWSFVLYIFLEIVLFCGLLYFQKRYCIENVFISLLLVAILGSVTVICAKGVSSMINLTFSGMNQLSHPLPYIMFILMVITSVAQVRFLNVAMKHYDATVVVPTNFVFFTISAILSGIMFYREFYGLSFLVIFMFLFGCFLSFVGVYCITSHRDEVSEDTTDKKNGIMTAGFLTSTSKLCNIQPVSPTSPENPSGKGANELTRLQERTK
ncbi:NIPA-like protein 2 [Xenia sp. Carnegie-2017]|uniref:NIPA-like protein 2 n=1 Tax=Xenia sp. Carnegie-2017 TaxID=2897299 RepID=UPI001F04A60E|nr:NIPA-like protein 2 [Xenia sp. Carnegie-2017]XP_046840413.1 NIPA-like protein 2 [Xenia sp. Carnegie-2017]XP_046840419.1 NIPA-like protein 2 [Xenia sp. Carnegie-2017]